MTFDPRLRSPKEPPLFAIGVALSSLCWLALVISIVGAVYGALILLAVLMAQAVFLAHIRGNGVRLSERQLPELHARCKAAATKLGLEATPEVYLVQSGGVLNAFATKLLSRRFVILYSSLVDACDDPRSLDFVIAHEMGHLAAGHLAWNAFLIPYQIMPWLGPAYSRAREYTSDRCGLFAVGDLEPSMRGLTILAAGGKQGRLVDLAAFMDQRQESGQFWMAVTELVSSHPFLCKRVAALQEISQPGTVKVVGRNVFAYPLAPFFGFSAGGAASGAMLMVVYLGILAAIAIPNFIKFQERAKAQQRSRSGSTRVQQPPPPESEEPAPSPAGARPAAE